LCSYTSINYIATFIFFLIDTATTQIYTLSLHDALPISKNSGNVTTLFTYITIINLGILSVSIKKYWKSLYYVSFIFTWLIYAFRSEEHTSELQSRENLVCRLLLEKKKEYIKIITIIW